MTRRIPLVHVRWAVSSPVGNVTVHEKLSSVSSPGRFVVFAVMASGEARSQSKAR